MAGIYQNLNSITTIKEEIKRSISEKGIDMSDIAFSEYPEKIDEIVQSGEYQDGYVAGKEEQKSKLQSITINNNGVYSTENGYSKVTVAVDSKCPELKDIKITENGVYNGAYKKVEVNVPITEDNYNEGYSEGFSQGFNSGVIEQKNKLESISITQNGTYTKEDGYNEVVVNVPSGGIDKIDVADNGLKFGNSKFSEVPNYLDFSNCTDLDGMFYHCSNLTTIPLIDTSNVIDMDSCFDFCSSLQTIPLIDTSNVTSMRRLFYSCDLLTTIPLIDTSNVTNMDNMFGGCIGLRTIPQLDTSNVTNMNYMFYLCSNLTTIPLIDTSNVTNMVSMFRYCNKLTTIPQLDTSNVTNMSSMFYLCIELTTLPPLDVSNVTYMNNYFGEYDLKKLTDVGGWINLSCDWNDDGGLASCPNLTYESCINILNGLAVVTELGSRTLKVHPNFLTTVGDVIGIGTSKGWTIASS